MATAEIIKRLSTRATAAEQMIQLLKKQIDQVRACNQSGGYAQEIQSLRQENAQLKAQVEEWKGKLVAAEKAAGIQQVSATSPPAAAAASKSKEPSPAPAQGTEKKEKPKKEKKEKAPAASNDGGESVDVGRLDMRVGLIRTAKKHPDADSLYVEEVDVGEDKPRTVISGLVKFIPEADMQNRKAILLCNLKPSKMRGIMSEAMVSR